jgi:glycosyltransferase involved in cell wall biosynthesis
MKILYVHQHFSCTTGSTGTRSYEFAKKLIEYGQEPIIICGSSVVADTGMQKPKNKYKILKGVVDGIKVIEINVSYSNYDGFFARVQKFLIFAIVATKLCFTENYDILMATSTPLTVGIPCLFVKLFRRKPIIFEVRDLWPDLPIALGIIKNKALIYGLKLFEKFCYKSADHCIALAPGIKKCIIQRRGNSKNVHLIPNASDFYLSKNIKNKDLSFKEKYFKQEDFITIFAGAHGIANGLDSVLEVAKYLMERKINNIKILFIGDGKTKPTLQEYAKTYELNNCIFLNPVSKIILFRDILPICNLGLMILKNVPDFYNGTSPNKFFDYISVGLPVLVNYPGWLADLINEYGCGYSVPPTDIKQFANILIQARDNKDELKNKGNRALQLAKDKFNREILAEQFVRVVEACI